MLCSYSFSFTQNTILSKLRRFVHDLKSFNMPQLFLAGFIFNIDISWKETKVDLFCLFKIHINSVSTRNILFIWLCSNILLFWHICSVYTFKFIKSSREFIEKSLSSLYNWIRFMGDSMIIMGSKRRVMLSKCLCFRLKWYILTCNLIKSRWWFILFLSLVLGGLY